MASRYHQELIDYCRNSSPWVSADISAALQIRSEKKGPRVTVFGAVHGDEPAGYEAILSIVKMFASKNLTLKSGLLTVVIGNEEALEIKKRYVRRDLNRLFHDDNQVSDSYETRRSIQLRHLLQKTDFLLDLHQVSAPSEPFLMCEREVLPVAEKLGVPNLIVGWGELNDIRLATDSETYCNSHGGKAITLECGQREWSGATPFALETTLRFLTVCGVLDRALPREYGNTFTLYNSERCTDTSFQYSCEVRSFLPLKRGQEIGRDKGRIYYAERDSFLIMPTMPDRLTISDEMYFLAVKDKKNGEAQ